MFSYLYSLIAIFVLVQSVDAQSVDGRNQKTGNKPQPEDPSLAKFALFEKNAPRPKITSPVNTKLPLQLRRRMSIAYVGNTLLDR